MQLWVKCNNEKPMVLRNDINKMPGNQLSANVPSTAWGSYSKPRRSGQASYLGYKYLPAHLFVWSQTDAQVCASTHKKVEDVWHRCCLSGWVVVIQCIYCDMAMTHWTSAPSDHVQVDVSPHSSCWINVSSSTHALVPAMQMPWAM
jgi:hypothetical protein